MLDHILEHLELAEAFDANAARIAGLKYRSKHSRDLIRRCHEVAERHRTEATDHTSAFGIDPQVLRQEHATWRRLRQYSLGRVEALTVADVRWLRGVLQHGRPGSRNFRRAAELLHLVQGLLPVDGRVLTCDDPDVQARQRNFADLPAAGRIAGRRK